MHMKAAVVPGKHVFTDAPVNGFSESNDQALTDNMLDQIVVLWNGDIKSSSSEPSDSDIIGNIE